MTKRTIDTSLTFLGICVAGIVLFLTNTAVDVQAASNDAKGWQIKKRNYEKFTQVSISDIQEPEEYSLRLDPKPGKKYRYVRIGKSGGSWVLFDERIEIRRDQNGQLLIDYESEEPFAIAKGRKIMLPPKALTPQGRHFVVRDGEIHMMNMGDGGTADFEMPPTVQDLAIAFPEDAQPQIGATWTFETKRDFEIHKGQYTLVGFAQVSGEKTAKLVSESEAYVAPADQDKVIEKTFSLMGAPKPDDSIIKKIKAGLSTPKKIKRDIYIDISTGMTVRLESESTHNNKKEARILQRIRLTD